MNSLPYILDETGDFAVVFKPPKMHSAPQKKKDNSTLLEWYADNSSAVFDLIHRLDFETHGLVLVAKNEKTYDFFKSLQTKGEFIKEYSAISGISALPTDGYELPAGFPTPPVFAVSEYSPENPLVIESYFRPYGPGGKQVRPVINDGKKHKKITGDRGSFYRTEIVGVNGNIFTVRIRLGFRHQIRCHLCWIGSPILNDHVYTVTTPSSNELVSSVLALRAHALFFNDPSTGMTCEYRIKSLLEKAAF
ncbi:MAG: RNA pseudouridine synthase [Treponema sp.]|jgi:23S rRNA pseudouridine1911/1915/1917 synthase|nr:RNA pseudouridine synthase [Treponema sp.]